MSSIFSYAYWLFYILFREIIYLSPDSEVNLYIKDNLYQKNYYLKAIKNTQEKDLKN